MVDQSLGFQLLECLPDRRPADVERVGDVLLNNTNGKITVISK